jgi:AraC-like DNA-binding protein/mannose-6-phosphate isomerase-like protein (cupin superfamily)
MNVKEGITEKNEYNISVEDISATILINKRRNSPLPEFFGETHHSHLYNELFVCLSNEINIQVEDNVIHLCKDDAAIIPANIPHYIIDEEPIENWLSIGFSVVKTSKVRSNLYKKLMPLLLDNQPKVFIYVPEICKRITELHTIPFEANDYFPALEIVSILSKLSLSKPQSKITDNQAQTRVQDIYRMAYFEDIIQNRFFEPLTISKLANALNLSTRQLSRIIKARFNMTFHEVLTEKRLEYAIDRLITSNHSVTSILREVGYTKSSLFYRDFSKKYNMTPTEYRNKFSKINAE